MLPVVADLSQLLRRLARDEEAERRQLASREDRIRRFEDVEHPAYESWLRLELGPVIAQLEELTAELRTQHAVAERVRELVEHEGLLPREALHVVRDEATSARPSPEGAWSREEIAARRRAKLERKRAERKQVRRERRATDVGSGEPAPGLAAGSESSRLRMTELYRALARRLHPDSPMVLRVLEAPRLRTIWAEVQAAYGARSLERMLALSVWLETVATVGGDAEGALPRGNPPTGLLSLSERHERLRALRRACGALDRRLIELASEPAWDFPSAPARTRRQLRKAATRRLAGELTQVQAALAGVADFLASIGPPRPPRRR